MKLFANFFKYVKKSPGSGFIILALLFFIVAAGFLLLKKEQLAEQMANLTYFLLVIGVIINFIRILIRKEG